MVQIVYINANKCVQIRINTFRNRFICNRKSRYVFRGDGTYLFGFDVLNFDWGGGGVGW